MSRHNKDVSQLAIQDPQDMALEWALECAARRKDNDLRCDTCPKLQRCQKAADSLIGKMFHPASRLKK